MEKNENSDNNNFSNTKNEMSDIQMRNYMTKQIELKLNNQAKEILELRNFNDLFKKNQIVIEKYNLSLEEKVVELKDDKVQLKEENVKLKLQIETLNIENIELKKNNNQCKCNILI